MRLLRIIGQSPTFWRGQWITLLVLCSVMIVSNWTGPFFGTPCRKATKQQTDKATAAMIPILGTHKVFEFLNLLLPCALFQTHVGVDIVTQPIVTRQSIFHSNETQSCHLQQRYWVVTKKDENLDKCYIGRQLLEVSCRCYNLRRNSMRDFSKYFAAFTEDKLMNPNWRSPLRGSFQTADTLQQVINLRRLTILNCVVGPVDWWVRTY